MSPRKRRPPVRQTEGLMICEVGTAQTLDATKTLRIQRLAQRFGLAPCRAALVAELVWIGGAA
jgi:hypothetical protein